ncbi:MAG: oligosaccharide flippase family protein [Candidatus Diapherotrites archaeon]|uniref:Oligosaccharide flippase family protein n=1 Tax=Candidatus Iainarchaeum sp. TaxID=3101447 RepID=A0A8T4LK49_9ARCH|nr:oligosaccharide flippase family protein [Candidatus Diapherotrites archaeon]
MPYEKVLKGASLLTLSNFVGGILSLAQLILVARVLTITAFGIFSLVTAIAQLASELVLPAFSQAVLTHYSKFALRGRGEVSKFMASTMLLTIACSIVVMGTLLLLSGFVANNLYNEPAILPYLTLAAFLVVLVPASNNLEAFLLAMERFKAYSALTILLPLMSLVLSAAAAIGGLGITGFVLALVVSQAINLGTILLLLRNHFTLRGLEIPRQTIKFWLPIGAGAVVKSVQGSLPALIIGKILGLEAVAFYGLARKTAQIVPSITDPYITSITVVCLNVYTRARNKFDDLLNLGIKHLAVLVFYLAGAFILLADKIILLFYGQKYAPIIYVAIFIAFALAVIQSGFFLRIVLFPRNASKDYLMASILSLVAQVALLSTMPLYFGLNGIGYSELLRGVTLFMIAMAFAKKHGQQIKVSNILIPMGLCLALLGLVGLLPVNEILAAASFTALYSLFLIGTGFISYAELKKTLATAFRKLTGNGFPPTPY